MELHTNQKKLTEIDIFTPVCSTNEIKIITSNFINPLLYK